MAQQHPKRILIVSPYATVSPHFETELEITQRHLDDGDRVSWLSCLGGLETCDFNPAADASRCAECRLRRQHGWSMIAGRVRRLDFNRYLDTRAQAPLPHPQNPGELRELRLDAFDWGFACLSSLVSLIRDPQPDLVEHRQQLNRLLTASRRSYIGFQALLNREPFDVVYVFNGRFANMRAIVRACQESGVTCRIHERGCDQDHFQIYENHLPHDIRYIESRMIASWQAAADDLQRESHAAQWYSDRVKCVEKNWHSFVKQQTSGLLPAVWDPAKENVALFTSSEDEFVAIGDCWKNQLFENQLQGIRAVTSLLARQRPGAHLTVRIHPNLKGVENAQTEALQKMQASNLTVLAPEDPVDSYQLMRESARVITFGSSMGIEAAYWGKPSILLGPSFYQNLGSVHRPGNLDDLSHMVGSALPVLDTTGALIYGYWLQTHGTAFRYFVADGLFSGKFKGQVVYPKPVRTTGERIRKNFRSVSKRFSRLMEYVRKSRKAA